LQITMLLFNVLVLLAAAIATASSLPPDTQKGPKCELPGDSPPICPGDLFCDNDMFCYPQRTVGQACTGIWLQCAFPAYCKYDFEKEEPGVCAPPRKLNESCGGHTYDPCDKNLSCLLPEGKDSKAVGKCVVVPRPKGDACNGDADCGENGFCQKANEDLRLGVCAQRAKLNQECSGPYGSHIAPPCEPDFACFVKNMGEKGVCMKNHGGAGDKCSFYGGLYCDDDRSFFCKEEEGKSYGDCAPKRRLGEKCVYHTPGEIPCIRGLSCYYEDNDKDGLCLKNFDNPLGSKCNWNVSCVEGAECHTAAGKTYGTCQKKVAGQ